MLDTMYVRCAHCGYDNSPEYRFCGMCGASLAHPPAPRQAAPVPPAPGKPPGTAENGTESVHGPSFLGLAEDPKVEFHYLYEDEQPSSHVGLIFFLLILFGAAGYLGWQWRHNGFPFNRLNAASAPARPATPSEQTPAPSDDQETHVDKPITNAGEVLPTAPEKAPEKANEKQADSGGKAGEQEAPNQSPSQPKAGAATSSTKTADQEESSPDADSTEEAKATPPSVPEKRPQAKPQPRTRAKASPPAPAAAPVSPDSDLELAGERYLYGNGLPRNCARAESNLRTAALHGNSKAQTVLGTMYATGHCVGRDLPTAYRWFARALHQEPQNSRISADLQVLWRQMTPQEKQLATSAQ
jgi:zinc-ribbon domain/Sel1 repeat